MKRWNCAAVSLVLGCASAHRAPPASEPASAAASVTAAPSAAPSSAAAPAAPPAAAASVVRELDLDWVRVLPLPVTAIALGDGTRIAVLAEEPYVGDARGLHPLALPAGLRAKPGDVDRVGIFFGRDNEPRIMGSRRSNGADLPIYWRHLPNGWRDGREEIGQLGSPARGGLWGVLGGADPELVCRTGAVCIIKRTSGWTTAPAGDSERIVTLQDGVLWGLDASGVAGIDKRGWSLAIPAPAWQEPRALWATQGEAWVSAQRVLFHYLAGQWQTLPSPVADVTSWWGARSGSVWLTGSTGAAHYDGQTLRRVAGSGALSVVRGRSNGELWFGGETGLFRAQARD